MVAFRLVFALAALSSVFAHPIQRDARELRIIGRSSSTVVMKLEANSTADATGSEFTAILEGNKAFRASDPALLQKLADEGQTPPFMFLGCSDSRVSEGTVFGAKPGTFFTQRNIANQFQPTDPNSQSVLAYAVAELGVKHIIVMGHYGCGGVAASIASAPGSNVDAANGAVQAWINPIREILQQSSRPELVTLREQIKGKALVEEPDIKDPGFRALVEENVKVGVGRIAQDSVIVNHYALLAANSTGKVERRSGEGGPAADVFIHGWVYDIENGEVRDLGISVGPPGKAIPPAPFAAVASAASQASAAHETPAAAASSSPAAHETPAAVASPSPAAHQVAPGEYKMRRSYLPRDH